MHACHNCVYFVAALDEHGRGYCMRTPPRFAGHIALSFHGKVVQVPVYTSHRTSPAAVCYWHKAKAGMGQANDSTDKGYG